MKTMLKKSSKKKRNPNRAPSGFVKPALISEELAAFLGKPIGTEMARTSVTKEINLYIKENSLGDKSNGRHIIPDEALSTLLKLKPEDELTYFNLQRFMSHHFTKSDSSKAVDVSKVAAEPVTV
jgi:chromatin remodeling complex protein RSC6